VSIYPCDLHGRRVPGPLASAYLTLLRGGTRDSRRMRLCPEHMDQVLGSESLGLAEVRDDGETIDFAVCGACGEDADSGATLASLFATVYRRGAERADYFSALCHACAERAVSDYRLDASN
jgi:hypothetical protein